MNNDDVLKINLTTDKSCYKVETSRRIILPLPGKSWTMYCLLYLQQLLKTICKLNQIYSICAEQCDVHSKANNESEICASEFAISYALEMITLILSLVYDTCSGYNDRVDKNTNTQQHNVCMLPRRKCSELFAEMAILLVGSQSIKDKVIAHLKSQYAMFNEKWIVQDGQSLIA